MVLFHVDLFTQSVLIAWTFFPVDQFTVDLFSVAVFFPWTFLPNAINEVGHLTGHLTIPLFLSRQYAASHDNPFMFLVH